MFGLVVAAINAVLFSVGPLFETCVGERSAADARWRQPFRMARMVCELQTIATTNHRPWEIFGHGTFR